VEAVDACFVPYAVDNEQGRLVQISPAAAATIYRPLRRLVEQVAVADWDVCGPLSGPSRHRGVLCVRRIGFCQGCRVCSDPVPMVRIFVFGPRVNLISGIHTHSQSNPRNRPQLTPGPKPPPFSHIM
jgi:hypothetical protein